MGFRFQKRVKLMPGLSINLSRSGISTSVGVKGARITMGHGKTRTTLGIPGTGISHTTITPTTSASPPRSAPALAPIAPMADLAPYTPTGWHRAGIALAGIVKILGVALLACVAVAGVLLAVLFNGTKGKR